MCVYIPAVCCSTQFTIGQKLECSNSQAKPKKISSRATKVKVFSANGGMLWMHIPAVCCSTQFTKGQKLDCSNPQVKTNMIL